MPGLAPKTDWLLLLQARASLIAGACLAIALRFAGTADSQAAETISEHLMNFASQKRSTLHPAQMASRPTRDMRLDRSTLDTCQAVCAVSLGMVLAGTGDLDALRILRGLRKNSEIETAYGVHMATHLAIGYLFLGGGKYTFRRDKLAVACLLIAAFPRWPTELTDNQVLLFFSSPLLRGSLP